MEICPMEHNAMLTYIETDRKHELESREYGPLGHKYSPMGGDQPPAFEPFAQLVVNSQLADGIFYSKALAAAIENEVKQINKDVNEHAARQHYVVCLLQPMSYTLYQPWLEGFNSQYYSITMEVMGGPSRLSFYGGRRWIDSELKKDGVSAYVKISFLALRETNKY